SGVEHDNPISAVRLCNAAKIRIVDIRIWIREVWMVEEIDGIGPELELRCFADANTLHQVDVETNLTWSFKEGGIHVAEGSRCRIHRDKAVSAGIRDRLHQARLIQGLLRC